MSNKHIYIEHTAGDRTPYVYVIRHIISKKIYVGVKFAIGCHPDKFFVDYFTSQNTVKQLLINEGINAFVIERIYVFNQSNAAIKFETKYLKRIKAKINPRVLNKHENDKMSAWGQDEFLKLFHEKYGVVNCSQLDWVQKKKERTQLKNYGDTHYMKQKIGRKQHIALMQEKHGVSNCSQLDWVKRKKEQTQLINYGTEYYIQTEQGKEKLKETMLEKHGVTNASCMEQVKQKKREKALADYGVDNVFKSEAIKQQIRQTNLKKYGVENFASTESERLRSSKNLSDQLNLSRDLIDKIKMIVRANNLKLGRGWHLKGHQYMTELYDKLSKEYSF